jgi:hypothetical protein
MMLVESYLPKPALDYITRRMTELMRLRPDPDPPGVNVPPIDPTPF